MKGSKDKKMKWYSSIVSCFFGEKYKNVKDFKEVAAPIGPEANMVAAAKHFSSAHKGQTKAKRLASLTASLAAVNLNSSYKRGTINHLSEGLNRTIAIHGKVILFIKHENTTPLYFLVCDSDQVCFILTVYGMGNDAIKEGDQVTLLEPCFHHVDFSWKGKCYQFKSIRVDFLEQMLVNGKAMPAQYAIRKSIFAQNKP